MAASVLKSLTLPIKDSLPPPTKELLYFEESDMVSTILQRFRTAGVTSAPVRRDGIFVGLIEITDLVHLLADICQRPKTSHVSPPSVSVEQDDMDQLLQRSTEFKVSTIGGSLSDRIKQRPFVTIAETAPFSELIALFSAQSNSGSSSAVHRVAVVPPGTERLTTIIRMVSQSDIAGFLVRHPSIFELSLKTPLSWMPMRAVCIAEENPVMQAVRTMHASNLSAVGVVDARGHLRNVFSASDLKNLMISWTMSELQTPIREFLLQRKEKHSPVTCVPTDTVSTALYRTTKFRVHRVVVVDEAGTPLGILSLTDLLHITVTATDQK